MRFVSLMAVLCVFGASAFAGNERDVQERIKARVQMIESYSQKAYEAFAEKDKAAGCFYEGLLAATAGLLVNDYKYELSNDDFKKANYVNMSMFTISPFCRGADGSMEKTLEASKYVRDMLSK